MTHWRACLLLTACVLTASSCIALNYERYSIGQALSEDLLGALPLHETTLTQALDLLGAPDEVARSSKTGMSLVWTWQSYSAWSLALNSISSEYGSSQTNAKGLRLCFDASKTLVRAQYGRVGQLRMGTEP